MFNQEKYKKSLDSMNNYDPDKLLSKTQMNCKEIGIALDKYKTNNFFSLPKKEQNRLVCIKN